MPLRVYGAVVTGHLAYAKNKDVDALDGLDNARSRTEILEKVIAESYTAIKAHELTNPAPQGTVIQRVFLAPEYYFSRNRFQDARFFNKAIKWWVLANMRRIARQYPDMLIVPGTLLWTEEALMRPSEVMKREWAAGKSKREAFEKAVLLTELKNRPQMAAMSEALIQGNSKSNRVNNYTASVAPLRKKAIVEAEENALPGQVGRRVKVLDPVAVMGPSAPKTLMAYNTAYVCLGSKVLEYHKVGNFREVAGETDPLIYFSGGIQGIFTVGGIRYGLEICRDHACSVLTRQVDIHLITSSYVDFTNSPAPLVLHSSTQPAGITTYKGGHTVDARTDAMICDSSKTIPVAQLKQSDSTVHVVDIPSLSPGAGGLEGLTIHEPTAWWA